MRWAQWIRTGCVAAGFLLSSGETQTVLCAAEPGLGQAVDVGSAARGQKADAAKPTESIQLLSFPADGIDPKAQPVARIWATVNGDPILAEEVRDAAQQQLLYTRSLPEPERQQRIEEILRATLDALVDREVVLQDAFGKLKAHGQEKVIEKLKEAARKEFEKNYIEGMKKATNAKSEGELKRILKEMGISLESARRGWERQFMRSEYLRSRVMPTIDRLTGYQQVEEYYETHPEEFRVTDMVDWQDLFVAAIRHRDRASAQKFAESLAERLRKGESFKALSDQYDDGDGRLRGGAGIGRKRGDIKPMAAEDILFRLKDGDVGPLIEMPAGFHVVRLVKRTYAGQLPFDMKAQKDIKNKLREEIYKREMNAMVKQIKKDAVIEYAR